MPYDEIRRRIVEVDEPQLSSEMLEQLLKFIPEPEQLQALAQLKDEIDSLAEPEQFCVVVRNFTLPLSSSPFFYNCVSHYSLLYLIFLIASYTRSQIEGKFKYLTQPVKFIMLQ